ncbi:MAG: hypothetical protein KAJ20_00355 [Candidatus Aenigmarchaeota archaeon]|nr:hypothetical protein [Candidatus Aenigmarchaeota archaeon]
MSKNRQLTISLLFILILVPAACSTSIEVNVIELLDTNVKYIDCCMLNSNVMSASYDVFNTGSVAYAARIRLDMVDGAKKVTSIWSSESLLNPGERDTINMYWYEPEDKTITASARLYRAYDIVDIGNITWVFNDASTSYDALDIEKIRVYDDKIKIKITAKNDTEKIIIYPVKYTAGWLFEQNVIEDVIAGKSRTLYMNYDAGVFREAEITLVAVSEDGKYYGENTFLLKKETGIRKWIGMFMDLFD